MLSFFSDSICQVFIRGLLENVGAEIDPIRLIRRIKNGLEIPGLKEALIKILQASNLQISLMEGCQTILDGDCSTLAKKLNKDQTKGFFATGAPYTTFVFMCSTDEDVQFVLQPVRSATSVTSIFAKIHLP